MSWRGLGERLSVSVQRPVYVPDERHLPLAAAPDDDLAPTLDIARKARVAPH